MRDLRQSRRNERGAILIVALIVATIVGISLASYISLNQSSLRLANRSFYNTAAMNLAETGAEEALWSFNQVTGGASIAAGWDGWDRSDGVSAKRTFTDFALHGNATSAVKVHVDRFDPPVSSQPVMVVQATITIPNEGRTLSKWIELKLRRRSRYAMGLVARNQITFRGTTASVDSWNSLFNDDGTPRAGFVDYSPAVRHDKGSVGSTSVAVGSVAVNNADIWGYASVGSASSSAISVGAGGTIAGFGSPPGTIDTTRVATDFTTNFDAIASPATGTTIAGAFPGTIGTAGATSTIRYAGSITSSFTVRGNVTLILTAGAGDAVRLTGGDSVTITPGSKLTIYSSADLRFGGNGITNQTNQPTALEIFGTKTTSGQSIDIGGGLYFKGLIYAPNADVTLNGNPNVMGSIVGNNITVAGNASFHYDEALAAYGGNNPWGVVRWRELTTEADRAAYASVMAGW